MTTHQIQDGRVVWTEPEHADHGRARVSLLRGGTPEVTLRYGAEGYGFVDERTARDLYRCLDQLFGPLAETRRAVRASVALADDPGAVCPAEGWVPTAVALVEPAPHADPAALAGGAR